MSSQPDFFARYASAAVGGAQRRRHGRVRCQDLHCTFGPVLDVSASGMRVTTALKPPKIGEMVATTLHSLDGPVELGCTVAWVRRAGLLRHELGLEFVDLPAFVRLALTRVARGCSQNEEVMPSVRELRRQGSAGGHP